MLDIRTGIGYDTHKICPGNGIILGGEFIPCGFSLLGHSDADVLLHAVIDAIFGSIAAGDIGAHFPDTDMKYKGISSLTLLKEASDILHNYGYELINIDSIIVAQKPKLLSFAPNMIKNIAKTLDISESRISIKFKTEEGLGFTGELLGIKAYATCLVSLRD